MSDSSYSDISWLSSSKVSLLLHAEHLHISVHTSEFLKYLHLWELQPPFQLQMLNSMSAKGNGRLSVIIGSREVPFSFQPYLSGDDGRFYFDTWDFFKTMHT